VGRIVDTRPRAGSRTKAGRAIDLDVSAGQQKTQVPQVYRLSVRRAQAAIENAGLRAGPILSEYSGLVPEGQVISTAPAAGLRVPTGTTLTIIVSMGSEAILEMPLLTGMTLNRARDVIINNGLVPGPVTEVSASQPAGTVVGQEPSEHTEIQPGDTVKLTVAKAGPAKPPEKKTAPPGGTTGVKKTEPKKDSGKASGKVKTPGKK
jgi:serine/threonine-protein kinase